MTASIKMAAIAIGTFVALCTPPPLPPLSCTDLEGCCSVQRAQCAAGWQDESSCSCLLAMMVARQGLRAWQGNPGTPDREYEVGEGLTRTASLDADVSGNKATLRL